MCTFPCKYNCCQRTFCPLELAYARTIHSFQGLQAGPVEPSKEPNMWEILVCDVDEKFWEGKNLGLLYTATSRGTTLGTPDGLGSAIYFNGPTFTTTRIKDLTFAENSSSEFELSIKRRRWVSFLHEQAKASNHKINLIMEKADFLVQWAKTTSVTKQQLHKRIDEYKLAMTQRKRKR